MANLAVEAIDDMIKDYLVFRGFTATLKSFENQIKNDKNKSFKVRQICIILLCKESAHDPRNIF